MKTARILFVITLAGCTHAEPPRGDRDAFHVGQTMIVADVDPESSNAMIYGDHFTGGFDVIPEGSHVTYLGGAKDRNNTAEPLSRISITEGSLRGVVCAIPTSSIHPLPPAP